MSEYDEVEGGWDDPELMEPVETLTTTGEGWDWVPPWEHHNGYGVDRRLWGEGRPPVSQRLAESLPAYEVAHFRGDVSWDYLRYRADRVMHRRDAHGATAEDVVNEVLIDMERVSEREGYVPGDREWIKTAEVVIRRKVGQLLRKQGGQKDRGNRYNERVAKFYGEYVALRGSKWYEHADPEDEPVDHDPVSKLEADGFAAQVFSDETLDRLSEVLTKRELEAVVYTYQDDLTNAQSANRMGVSESAVSTLLGTARQKLQSGGFTP